MEAVGKSIVVPRLRFPAFRNAEGWTSTTLGLEASFYKGKGISKSEIDPSGSRPCIRYGELYTRYSEVIRDVYSRTNVDQAELFLSQENDVIIPGSGETKEDIATASCVALAGVALGGDLNVIRTPHNGVFLSYYLNGTLRRKIAKIAQGDTVVHLYPSQLEGVSIAFPQSTEQQKIADCLTSLDEVIAAQGRKVEALKTHKRGLMQQLFPREGETLPQLRYPEFRDAPDWEEVQLGRLFDTTSGGTPDRAKREYWSGTIPWVTTSLVDFNVVTKAHEFISEAGLENSSAKLLPKGTILIAMYGQGKTRGKVAMLGIAAATNQACAAILPNDKIDQRFALASLCSRYEEMRALSNSGGQENLSQGLIRGLPFRYPKDVGEQSKIVSCVSALDFAIAAESEELEALKIHKRGLMQQLFPSPVEV